MRVVRDRRSRFGLAVLAIVCALVASIGTASATADYRVDYTLTKILFSLDPDVAPAGANRWDCKPSAAHPRPVILVHGWAGNQHDNWTTLSPLLANNGYCVFALNYGGNPPIGFEWTFGMGPMEQSAQELSSFVDRVRAASGAAKVDLVGHSEGATMPFYYLKYLGGDAKVANFVAIASVLKGTNALALLAFGNAFGFTGVSNWVSPALNQFLVGSDFLRNLSAGGVTRPGVQYTSIMTRYLELIVPYTSGKLPAAPNVRNVVVQDACWLDFTGHLGAAFSPNSLRLVLNALDPAHAQRSCRFVPAVF